MIWEKLNNLVSLLFNMTDEECTKWVAENKHKLSRAEMIFLERLNGDEDAAAIESLMDRVIGKTLKIEGEMIHRNPLIEQLYDMGPGALREDLDQLKRNKEIIDAEYKSIEAVTVTGASGTGRGDDSSS